MAKILIATLTKNSITPQTTFSLVNMVKGMDNVSYAIQTGADVPGGRTILINRAREHNFTHILFVDEDVSFPSDSLTRLVAHNKDIIGADYNFRELPLRSMATADKKEKDKPFKCKSLPTGFMLIKLAVFDKVPTPWFLFEWNDGGKMVFSEDVYFCRKAIEVGFGVWCDPTINVKHIGQYAY
jgi:hypothetical protein